MTSTTTASSLVGKVRVTTPAGASAARTISALPTTSLLRLRASIVQVTAVPAMLDWSRIDEALRAVASSLDGLGPTAGVDDLLRRVAATMACHAAVKANDPLTYEKMTHILDELRATAYSTVCPHGRPVMLRLTRREIEKNFERI